MTSCGPVALAAPAPPPFFGRLRPHCTLTGCPSTLTPTPHCAAASSAASRLTKLTNATLLLETRTTLFSLPSGTRPVVVNQCRIESSVAVAGREVRNREVCRVVGSQQRVPRARADEGRTMSVSAGGASPLSPAFLLRILRATGSFVPWSAGTEGRRSSAFPGSEPPWTVRKRTAILDVLVAQLVLDG